MEDFHFYKTSDELMNGEKLIKSKEYKLEKDNNSIGILLGRTDNCIIIRNLYNEIKINKDDFSILTKIIFNSIDEAYEYLKQHFDDKKVTIKINEKRILKLLILTYDPIKRKDKEIEICLKSQIKNEDDIINTLIEKYIKLEKKLNNIQKENEELKKENTKIRTTLNEILPDIEMFKEIFGLNQQECTMILNNQMQNNQMNNNQMNNNQMNNNQMQNNQMNNFPNFHMAQILQRMRMNNPMNQIQQMNNNLNQANNINVFFKRGNHGVIVVTCFSNETINNLISRYRFLSGDNNSTKFMYNGMDLNLNLMSFIEAAGIRDNSFIDVQ